jgi:hypothetical protein
MDTLHKGDDDDDDDDDNNNTVCWLKWLKIIHVYVVNTSLCTNFYPSLIQIAVCLKEMLVSALFGRRDNNAEICRSSFLCCSYRALSYSQYITQHMHSVITICHIYQILHVSAQRCRYNKGIKTSNQQSSMLPYAALL